MSNITYIYSTMNAGKTAQAAMLAHSLQRQGKKVKVYKMQPHRIGEVSSILESRSGIDCTCTEIGPLYDFSSYLRVNADLDFFIIDECHFLSDEQIEYLAYCGKRVFLVGLKVNFLGKVFDSIQKILTYEPKLVHIPSICSSPNCLEDATHHILLKDGEVVRSGDDKLLGDVHGDKVKYIAVCKMHYHFQVTELGE